MATQTHVFNQYYFDLLRKVKNIARDLRKVDDDNQDARAMVRAIKKSYATFDRASDEYREWFVSNTANLEAFLLEDGDKESWDANDAILAECPYKEIDIALMHRLLKSKSVLLYYLTILCVFAKPMETEELTKVIQVLKGETVEGELSERFSKLQNVLKTIEVEKATNKASGPSDEIFKELEKTSLGKLAKEIMSEVNLDEISNTVGDGDIMSALTNPDGGLTKLLGTVSQKMISKMASGEIKQENLLADALKLATSIPGMMPGGGGKKKGGLGDMGSMLSQVSKMASMFGGNGDDDFGSMLNSFMGGDTRRKATVNTPAVNRAVMAKQMRRKLEKRRKAKENIEN